MSDGRTMLWRYGPILLIIAGLVLAYACDVQHYLSIDHIYEKRRMLKAYVAENLWLSAMGYVLFYAIAVAFIFPAPLVLTVVSGLLFGWWLGGMIAVVGATIGACILFLAARTAFKDVLRRKADGAMARFADGFRRDAFTYLLVLRLTPVLPVALVNIVPAFFDISLRSFSLATLLGMIPGAMVYAFLGSGLDRALKHAGQSGEVSLAGLLTTEMIAALAGLTLMSLLGLALKRWFLPQGRPAQ